MIILSYMETSESFKTVKTCLKQKKKEKQQKNPTVKRKSKKQTKYLCIFF